MKFFRILPLIFAIVLFGGSLANADVQIDFEDPLLGFRGQQVLDPFISDGVRFTAMPHPNDAPFNEVVGIVWNELNNACIEPANRNVKLGTGQQSVYPNGGIGWAGFPIKAEMITPITPDASRGDQVEISVEFQTVMGAEVRMRLYDGGHNLVVTETATVTSNRGDCGKLGGPRGTVSVTAVTTSAVAYAILDIPKSFFGGIAYVIDDFKVRFTRGVRPIAVPDSELCGRLQSANIPFNVREAGCQNLEDFEILGDGEFKAHVGKKKYTQVLSGRNVCNTLTGGCVPCPIDQFVCPNYELIFSDVYAHDLQFTTTFDISVHDYEGQRIGQTFRNADGSVSVNFAMPKINSKNEECGFFVVLQPKLPLPPQFDFWGHVRLVVRDADPLGRFDVNHNMLIDNSEFFALMDDWTEGFIPDQLFFQGLDHWLHQLPLRVGGVASGQDSAHFELKRLGGNLLSFQAVGAGVSTTRVQIYNTGGQAIFDQTGSGSRLIWNLRDVRGNRVANGVYFYRVTTVNSDGTRSVSDVRKFVVMN